MNGAGAKLTGEWKPFAEAGLLPDPSGLFLIARAITPPGRVRRFDTRFFTADASAIAHQVEGVVHADAELVELVWVELGSQPLADAHMMTKMVLRELDQRLATGPLSHNAVSSVFPFLRRQNAARHHLTRLRSIPRSVSKRSATSPVRRFMVLASVVVQKFA